MRTLSILLVRVYLLFYFVIANELSPRILTKTKTPAKEFRSCNAAEHACIFICFVYRRTMDMDDVIKAFGALAQDTRLKILNLLVGAGHAGLPAGDISLALGVPQNTLSFHLNQLEYAGLINRRRAGRYIIYSSNHEGMKNLLRYMVENCCDQSA